MPFVIRKSESYRWPVEYKTPTDDGKYDRQQFTAEFKRLDQPRLDEIYATAKAGEFHDVEVAAEVLVGWAGVSTASGEPFDFTDNNRDVLLALPGMRAAVLGAFFDSVKGAARKN